MSRAVFVDTWFFIAYLHKFERDHAAAQRLARAFRDATFVTHDGVFTEVLTFFSGQGAFWRKTASTLVREVLVSRRYQAKPLSRELFENALALYERRSDKEYSLVDCMSMHLMLAQEGFTVLSDTP